MGDELLVRGRMGEAPMPRRDREFKLTHDRGVRKGLTLAEACCNLRYPILRDVALTGIRDCPEAKCSALTVKWFAAIRK